jgi:hypothetical protein
MLYYTYKSIFIFFKFCQRAIIANFMLSNHKGHLHCAVEPFKFVYLSVNLTWGPFADEYGWRIYSVVHDENQTI